MKKQNPFALGESFFGAGKKSTVVVGLTLGTGLGCGIVCNRKIYPGRHDSAGEIWLAPYEDGIIEDKISGKGLTRLFQIKSGKKLDPKAIQELAGRQDQDAVEVWAEFGKHLAYCIAWTVHLLDPDLVILGGSLSKAMKYFAPSMEEYLRRWLDGVPAKNIKVKRAGLAGYGGMVGAACLVLSAAENRKG